MRAMAVGLRRTVADPGLTYETMGGVEEEASDERRPKGAGETRLTKDYTTAKKRRLSFENEFRFGNPSTK